MSTGEDELPNDGWLRVEIDGENVSLDHLPAAPALSLASAYIDLVLAISRKEKWPVTFSSIQLEDKCAAFALLPDEPGLTAGAVALANEYVNAPKRAPYGYRAHVKWVQSRLEDLPPGHTARVIMGPWATKLAVSREHVEPSPYETISVRAIPIRVGGLNDPSAWFHSESEAKDFILRLKQEAAKELGAYLYQALDITATVARNYEGNIEEGTLRDFEPLEDGDATAAWRTWFHEHASEWNDVIDIEGELERGPDR